MYIIFDTETNGLPVNYNAPAENVDNWPRISQISWQIFNKDRTLIKLVDKYIYPDGWKFPDTQFFKDNANIELNKQRGLPIKEVLNDFIEDRKKCNFTIGHNLSFDSKIVRAEMFRAGLNQIEFDSVKICTMLKSTSYCNITGNRGAKWPKLEELHRKLFNCDFEGAHNSDSDVSATAKCFFKLVELGVINLDQEIEKHNEKKFKFNLPKVDFSNL